MRRLNVAITRAAHALWILGHAATLSAASATWRALFDDARTYLGGCLVSNADAATLFPDAKLWHGGATGTRSESQLVPATSATSAFGAGEAREASPSSAGRERRDAALAVLSGARDTTAAREAAPAVDRNATMLSGLPSGIARAYARSQTSVVATALRPGQPTERAAGAPPILKLTADSGRPPGDGGGAGGTALLPGPLKDARKRPRGPP